jgi:copper chaperone CopZ
MKKYILFVFTSIIFLSAKAQVKQATLQASGLTCSLCSNSIFKALKTLAFVADVKSDIKNSSFAISFKPNAKVDFDAIEKKVSGAGFSVADLKVLIQFNNIVIKNDAHVVIGEERFHFLNVQPQTLQGEKQITIIDKKFVPAKQFAKYNNATKMECQKTGIMDGVREYHVTI